MIYTYTTKERKDTSIKISSHSCQQCVVKQCCSSTLLHTKFELKVFNYKLSNILIQKGHTLNFVGRIKWNTIVSPSAKSWSTENLFHPPLSPNFWAKYTVGHSSPVSSIKVIVSSLLGRFFLQKFDGRPCSMSCKWVTVRLHSTTITTTTTTTDNPKQVVVCNMDPHCTYRSI